MKKILKKNKFLTSLVRSFRVSYLRLRLPKYQEHLKGYFKGNPAMESGKFESNIQSEIKRQISNSNLFVNIGANYGYYCLIASKLGTDFMAFEPHPTNFEILLDNLSANEIHNEYKVFRTALGDNNGIAMLYGSGTAASLISGWAAETKKFKVPSMKFDNFLGELQGKRVFVLIDVEGAENLVLNSATTILKNLCDVIWMIEICPDEHLASNKINADIVLQKMVSYGYSVYYLNEKNSMELFTGVEINFQQLSKLSSSHNYIFKKT